MYSFASFLNFMDGDKADPGFDRAPLRVQGGGGEKEKQDREGGRRGLVAQRKPNE